MLIGLGLGPGDPELLTLRAVRLLREADAVFVPGEHARRLVAPYRAAEVLEFPMTDDESVIRRAMEANADRIAAAARDGTVVFALLGDPNFFSTFSRLAEVLQERHPQIACTTEPGVSAITACCAAAGIAFTEGFVVTDGSPVTAQVLLKVRRPRETVDRLKAEGYTAFVLLERIYMDEMQVCSGDDIPPECGYFSILVARR
jgi:precorrin-2/cobalt-factor-2 C20-methyltransferase